MKRYLIFLAILPFMLSGCLLISFPHTLEMPSESTVVVKDFNTGMSVDNARVIYVAHEYENWIKPIEWRWGFTENCVEEDPTDNDKLEAKNRDYGLYRFSQETRVGWSKLWGIGPLGSWLYDTYHGYYYICSPDYHGVYFSDSLHSNGFVFNEYIMFEEDKITVHLIPVTEEIPAEKRSHEEVINIIENRKYNNPVDPVNPVKK